MALCLKLTLLQSNIVVHMIIFDIPSQITDVGDLMMSTAPITFYVASSSNGAPVSAALVVNAFTVSSPQAINSHPVSLCVSCRFFFCCFVVVYLHSLQVMTAILYSYAHKLYISYTSM